MGSALGPALGGLLTAAYGWPAAFGAAIPVLLVGLALGWLLLPADPPRGSASLVDGLGAGLLTGSILTGILAIQQVATSATRPIALAAAGLCLLLVALFIMRERSTERKFLELSLFRVRGFVVTTLVAHVQMLTLGAILALAPLYLISVRGLRPDAAGGLIFPLSVALLGSAVVGRWSDRRVRDRWRWGARS
jgi:predicted MFS family arabinose efflux permease